MKQSFMPPDLPPQIDLSSIIKLIADANIAVARYDEAVKRLPNPMLIRRSFETKEAVLSSKIEGTQATLEEVLSFDAATVEAEDTEILRDYREIRNYRKAIDYGKNLLHQRPLDENLVKELHRLLLNSVRGESKSPGQFRRHAVHIGPAGATQAEASYIPPPHIEVTRLFSNLVKYMQNDDEPDRLVQAAIAHYQFEAIHPFADGNGRVGRLLIPIYLFDKGVTSNPNLYVSEFLEKHRRDYYELLRRVSEDGDWISWISFFLRAIREQALVSKNRVDSIDDLYQSIYAKLPEFKSIYAANLLDAIFANPVFTIPMIAEKAKIPYGQSIYNLVAKFSDAGLVVDTMPTSNRNKTYAFYQLLTILNSN